MRARASDERGCALRTISALEAISFHTGPRPDVLNGRNHRKRNEPSGGPVLRVQDGHNWTMSGYEQLGLFYLGKRYDLHSRTRLPELLLYDSKDLLTHAMCVGMTGSGKTGLGIGLIEEAAIDAVPVLAIDPKGDLSNLLLTFPNLAQTDFL